MIETAPEREDMVSMSTQVAVIGAGPAGIVSALRLAKSGLRVLLVESGQHHHDDAVQALSEAATWDREIHAEVPLAVSRQIGGTSNIWGGRCVPYDPIDFADRSITGRARWPVSYSELAGHFGEACEWFMCGRPSFNAEAVPSAASAIVPGFEDGEVIGSSLERWSLPTDFGREYSSALATAPGLRVVTGLTCVSITCNPGELRAQSIECRSSAGKRVRVLADRFIIACGGLESTRLLLASVGPFGGSLGNHSDHLGRYYMAHIEGVVGNVRFTTPPKLTNYDYARDIDGVYVRRRFTLSEQVQLDQGLPNIAMWLANPELADASHGLGMLSFVYLMLASPLGKTFAPDAQRLSLLGKRIPGTPYGGSAVSPLSAHLRNVLREPLATSKFAFDFGSKRLLARGRKSPGFFAFNAENVYPLEYHAEHLPNPESRVRLSNETDRLGLRKLDIDIRFADADFDGVARALDRFDQYIRNAGLGQLEYFQSDVMAAVQARAGGGFHQIGTTRMSEREEDGVVDRDLAVHHAKNVHVVSSSTFVTSGQANSTFMIVVMALRLADHLRKVMVR